MEKRFNELREGDLLFVGRIKESSRGEYIELNVHPVLAIKNKENGTKTLYFFYRQGWFREIPSGSFTIPKTHLNRSSKTFPSKKLSYGTNIVKVLNNLRNMISVQCDDRISISAGWCPWTVCRFRNSIPAIALFAKLTSVKMVTKFLCGKQKIKSGSELLDYTQKHPKKAFAYGLSSALARSLDCFGQAASYMRQKGII